MRIMRIKKAKMKNRLAIKISGPAGTGIMQAGETFSKALNRLGFFTLVYPEYPSRIRGGDNNIQIVFSAEEEMAVQEKVDILLAFGEKNLEIHKGEAKNKNLVFESDKIGLGEIVKSLGNPLVLNTAGLGFLWAILGLDLAGLREQIKSDFSKDKKIADLNTRAVEKGYERGRKIEDRRWKIETEEKKKIVNLTGNEVLVRGILAGDCGFAAIYPMTPINEILRLLVQKRQVSVFRPEDEIAGIMASIGASYAGKRAVVATSGGGFSLMVEGFGLSGMAEIPLVVVLGQRTGPSSGMATFSSQADLSFVINAGHGEFPRIVLTPGDLPELYRLGAEAFNLAEIYQVPVVLMTDKYLAESRFSVEEKKLEAGVKINRGKLAERLENYQRYLLTKDGISPRAFPGQAAFLTNSYEHDEKGFSSDDAENRRNMMKKRMKKLVNLPGGLKKYGPKEAGNTLVSWGSTKGVLLDFIKDHPEYNLIHFYRPWPFPKEGESELKKCRRLISVEGNYSGQLADLIKSQTGLKAEKVLKDDGRPFHKEELERLLK